MAEGLFRVQAVQASRRRLWGDMLLVQPPGTATMLVLVLAFLAAAAALLAFGEFTRTERVSGYLVPEGGVIGIRTPQPGLVTRVRVAEGDRVAAGARLVQVRDPRALDDGVHAGAAALDTIDDRLARLIRLRGLETARFEADRAADRAGLERIGRRRTNLVERRSRLARRIELDERALARLSGLAEAGHVSRQRLERAEAELLEAQRRHQALQGALLELAEERARLVRRLDGWSHRRGVRLAELDDRRDRLRRERYDTGGRVEFWLRAPRAGRVASLGVVEGESVRPGQDLLTLLEPDARMDAILLVPSRAVGFVRAGQRVRLLYDAFPYTRFGVHAAEVSRVGRSILAPSELGGPAAVREPVYKVRARPVRRGRPGARGETFPLQAGMALEADIELEQRPLWHWLLEPLLALEGRL
ncbi:MAG: HlyD family efflux transporter periplasmic adaptor subunit [Gammaproteobacteria bacterium]|nr:HlyD family efflux transporter periplasmic adaptor subunit [Gammaproteobacteria bacterium]